tara:strand:+ start:631 stop:882 length:252 start_codon:yes stop_codon:yes gene_type:complete
MVKDLDLVWDHQEKSHTCEKDRTCAGCDKKTCELCSIHSMDWDNDGAWVSHCKSCSDKRTYGTWVDPAGGIHSDDEFGHEMYE